tara:strand:- start:1413 stop:1652 length:240 start_codon:yes stop_codon:yes gene_type:complete
MEFKVYSKNDCPHCYKIKQILEMTGNNFQAYTLDEDFNRDEFYEKFGEESTFPQVICNDEVIGGSVATIKFLKQQRIVE